MFLKLIGWRIEGRLPPVPKAVIVVAPHTSNWDFIVGVLVKWTLELDVAFIGKHTLFRGPLGWWMRRLGGIPVDRSKPGDIVAQVVARMKTADALWFVIAPEGTRKRSGGWKNGFRRIALEAGVPVVPVAFDAGTKTVRIGAPVEMTDDVGKDFAALARFYEGVKGINAENASPVVPV